MFFLKNTHKPWIFDNFILLTGRWQYLYTKILPCSSFGGRAMTSGVPKNDNFRFFGGAQSSQGAPGRSQNAPQNRRTRENDGGRGATKKSQRYECRAFSPFSVSGPCRPQFLTIWGAPGGHFGTMLGAKTDFFSLQRMVWKSRRFLRYFVYFFAFFHEAVFCIILCVFD